MSPRGLQFVTRSHVSGRGHFCRALHLQTIRAVQTVSCLSALRAVVTESPDLSGVPSVLPSLLGFHRYSRLFNASRCNDTLEEGDKIKFAIFDALVAPVT